MSSSTAYPLGMLGLVLLGVGELLHIIGLSTPEWSVYSSIRVGLWEACNPTCQQYILKPAEVEVCEAFAIIGMLAGLLAAALGLMFFVLTLANKSVRLLAIGAAVAANVALISILVCVIVWGAAVHPGGIVKIGYSFALSIAGGIIHSLGGDIIFIMSRQHS
ncbi:unnamed protein product [Candidula unifasciata]|uniref:Claudin n=1 Tax=Candidula unifasciata TaxID=100452 RepID=A0A8S3YUD9_9EUPU|nr:unnamed protein product [Candidula unifasciata]